MTAPYRTILHRFYRSANRHDVQRASTLRSGDGTPVDVLLEDVSTSGCRISGAPDLRPGEAILIGLAGVGARPAHIVWAGEGEAGCAFDQPLGAEELDKVQRAQTVITGDFPAAPVIAEGREPRLRFRARLGVIALAIVLTWSVVAGLALAAWRWLSA